MQAIGGLIVDNSGKGPSDKRVVTAFLTMENDIFVVLSNSPKIKSQIS